MAVDVLWTVLTILALLALVPNAASLAQGIRLRGHVRRAMRLAFGAYLPPVVLVLPVRGLDEGFDDNVRAILSQAYPRFRILVVADDPAEPAAARARDLAREFPRIPVTLILSEPATVPGKVNALRSALSHVSSEDEVVVFADSDIRPPTTGLRVRACAPSHLTRKVAETDDDGRPLPSHRTPLRGNSLSRVQRIRGPRTRVRGPGCPTRAFLSDHRRPVPRPPPLVACEV